MIREQVRSTIPGWLMVPVIPGGVAFFVWRLAVGIQSHTDGPPTLTMVLSIVAAIVTGLLTFGFFVVNPNEAKVLQLFGSYAGTVKTAGFHWANPLLSKRRISLRVRNFESAKIKVNDHEGNPIEIAAVVVWRVVDTAEASFEVDDYDHYVKVQSEAAIRNLATQHPYDAHIDGERSIATTTNNGSPSPIRPNTRSRNAPLCA